MARILDPRLTWTIQDKMIVISQKPQVKKEKNVNVSGTVVDTNGMPVIGASVTVKGTSNGSITDMDGKFSIAGVPENSMINISYIT